MEMSERHSLFVFFGARWRGVQGPLLSIGFAFVWRNMLVWHVCLDLVPAVIKWKVQIQTTDMDRKNDDNQTVLYHHPTYIGLLWAPLVQKTVRIEC